jgi:hypothetical protein
MVRSPTQKSFLSLVKALSNDWNLATGGGMKQLDDGIAHTLVSGMRERR